MTSKLKTDSMGRITYRMAKKEYLKPYNYLVKLKFRNGTQHITVTSRRELSIDSIFKQAQNMASDPKYSFGPLEEIVIEEAYLNMGAVLK